MSLEAHLRAERDAGNKLLGIYVTAGVSENWIEHVAAAASGGASFIEIGLPFSDPTMDGPVIQAASEVALGRGVTTASALKELTSHSFKLPLVAMTYYNVMYSLGIETAATMLNDSGISGSIIPDLPFDTTERWQEVTTAAGIDNILLAAPSTSDARLSEIAKLSRGFIYAVGLMGVTGVRSELSETATDVAKRLRSITDKPVLVGVGISTPEQASAVSQESDGVIVGSAVMKLILDGEKPASIENFVRSLRESI